MNVGANIRRIREEKGISQKQISEKVGVSQAMICQIERGTKNPSLQIGMEIAKVFNCTVDELLGGQ